MRARNVKPAFFKNELLATSDPLYSLIFEGLWCIADREGRLEDRPRRIHFEINAGRAYELTEQSLNWLAENGFIQRYEHGGARYIQVVNFKKHQNPHHREPESTIPAQGQPGASPSPAVLIPDSGFRIPDSPSLIPEEDIEARTKRSPNAKRLPDDFSLTEERKRSGQKEGIDPDREFSKFIDYWRSASGGKARKHDWDAAWRNWCRNANDFRRDVRRETTPTRTWRPTDEDSGPC